MTNKTSRRSALLLAAGLFVCFAGPSQAAAGAEDTAAAAPSETAGTPVALHKFAGPANHSKKYAHRNAGKVAQKASAGNKTADAADDGERSSAIPPSVANANAQLTAAQSTSADAPTGNAAKAMTARANDVLQTSPGKPADAPPAADTQSDAQVVAADQLNDVDRALRQNAPPATTPPAAPLASASAEASAAPVAAHSNNSSSLDETSLIGKIFIGFGALLTMASAARMFMA